MFKIHFLNVAQGDCTIIRHQSGRLTMIDINNDIKFDNQTLWEFSIEQTDFKKFLKRKNLEPGGAIKHLCKSRMAMPVTNPVEFLKANYPGQSIFRYIQTHPNLTQMRGLTALREAGIEIENFWDTDHSRVPELLSEKDQLEWAEYQELRSGRRCKVWRAYRGEIASHEPESVADGITVLAPIHSVTQTANESQN